MPDDKRIIDGYTELYAVRLDGAEEIVAENLAATDQYRIYTFTRNNPLIAEYCVAFACDDYLKVMREFVRRLGVRLDALDLERVYRGSPLADAPLLPEDCAPGGMDADLTGKVVAIKQESLAPEFRATSHQLHLATGGFGCAPKARGRAVYCTDIYSGKQVRWERYDILGVIAEDALPQWAREKLAALRDPANRESTLAKLREGKKTAAEQPRRKKERDNGGPEL
ncbi:MAG: hypothetical protein LBP73_04750 [Clostridiales Family XIII bacterium]|jgi:hypothetical protein|nr:hypothetical protein [Clostridiales Family XIII bacterium]